MILSFLSAFDSRPECLVEVCNKILAILKTNTNLSTKVTEAVKTTAGPTVSVPPSSHNCIGFITISFEPALYYTHPDKIVSDAKRKALTLLEKGKRITTKGNFESKQSVCPTPGSRRASSNTAALPSSRSLQGIPPGWSPIGSNSSSAAVFLHCFNFNTGWSLKTVHYNFCWRNQKFLKVQTWQFWKYQNLPIYAL